MKVNNGLKLKGIILEMMMINYNDEIKNLNIKLAVEKEKNNKLEKELILKEEALKKIRLELNFGLKSKSRDNALLKLLNIGCIIPELL